MLGSPVALQHRRNHLLVCLDPTMAQLRQHLAITLTYDNRLNDRQSGLADYVAQYRIKLQIHLLQRHLHMLHRASAVGNRTPTIAHVTAQLQILSSEQWERFSIPKLINC